MPVRYWSTFDHYDGSKYEVCYKMWIVEKCDRTLKEQGITSLPKLIIRAISTLVIYLHNRSYIYTSSIPLWKLLLKNNTTPHSLPLQSQKCGSQGTKELCPTTPLMVYVLGALLPPHFLIWRMQTGASNLHSDTGPVYMYLQFSYWVCNCF